MTVLGASAHDFEVDGFYYNITSLENLTVAVTCDSARALRDGGSYSGDIVIPRSVTWNGRTFAVNEVQEAAFAYCTLTSLTVPETVSRLMLCDPLDITKLVIEDSEETLDFSLAVRNQGYSKYARIEELYLGRLVNEGYLQDFGHVGLKRVSFGEKVTEINGNMFSGCTELPAELALPEHIRVISGGAFSECTGIEVLSAPGVEQVGVSAFIHCESLRVVEMPHLKVIGDRAFSNCVSLVSYEIPRGVSEIGASAFEGCTGLEAVTIPNSVLFFSRRPFAATGGGRVFAGCAALKSITVNAAVPFELNESDFDALTYVNATLHVPSGSEDAYRNAPVWKNFFNIDGAGATDDTVYSIYLNSLYPDGGYIEVGGAQIGEREYLTVDVPKSGRVTMRFVPPTTTDEMALSTVTINGEEMLDRVVDNELSLEMTANLSVSIGWSVEPDPVYLTIRQAESGSMKMEVSEWETYRFYVEPSEGWRIHAVTFNGEDITSSVGADGLLTLSGMAESSVLSVVFEQDGVSVAAVAHSNAKVYGFDGEIVISGVASGEPIAIYNEAGMQLRSFRASGNVETVAAEKGHIYIVKLDGKTVKLAL